MSNTKILIVDDHSVVVEGIKRTLDYHPDVEVVGEAYNGVQAIEMVKKHSPDIIVMDISMPDMDGLKATKKIKELSPDTCIIIFSAHARKDLVVNFFKVGISGYVLKQDHISDLILAIEAVRGGGTYFSKMAPAILLGHLKELEDENIIAYDYGKLTLREREVFRMLADGKTINDIAEEMCLSKKTIETHKYNILKKFGVRTTSELTKIAVKKGLISP